MSKHRSVSGIRLATEGQRRELRYAFDKGISDDLTFDEAQEALTAPSELTQAVRRLLRPRAETDADIFFASASSVWDQFCRTHFDSELDGWAVIPEKKNGFDWLITVPQGLTVERVLSVKERVLFCATLDRRTISTNTRNPSVLHKTIPTPSGCVPYRSRRGASQQELQSARGPQYPGITLLEYCLLHLFQFVEDGGASGLQAITLCTGSLYGDGSVLSGGWYPGFGKFFVHWKHRDDADYGLRCREVAA